MPAAVPVRIIIVIMSVSLVSCHCHRRAFKATTSSAYKDGQLQGQRRREPCDGVAAEVASALAHAFDGLRRAARMHLRLDSPADISIDILPVLEGPFEHLAVHAAEQAARDSFVRCSSLNTSRTKIPG